MKRFDTIVLIGLFLAVGLWGGRSYYRMTHDWKYRARRQAIREFNARIPLTKSTKFENGDYYFAVSQLIHTLPLPPNDWSVIEKDPVFVPSSSTDTTPAEIHLDRYYYLKSDRFTFISLGITIGSYQRAVVPPKPDLKSLPKSAVEELKKVEEYPFSVNGATVTMSWRMSRPRRGAEYGACQFLIDKKAYIRFSFGISDRKVAEEFVQKIDWSKFEAIVKGIEIKHRILERY